jgi:hypothetical protein
MLRNIIIFIFILTGCINVSSNKRLIQTVPNGRIVITGIKYAYSSNHRQTAKYLDSMDKYQLDMTDDMASILDSFVFDKNGPFGFIRYDHYKSMKTGKLYIDTTRFERYTPVSRDSLKYMPAKILDFELQGIFMNSEKEDGDDVDRFGFYLNPKTNEVLQIMHMFYIGNPDGLYVYTYNNKNPFKGNEKLVKEILRMEKPLDSVNHVRVEFHITNDKVDSTKVIEY